jgi:O-antigen ligase
MPTAKPKLNPVDAEEESSLSSLARWPRLFMYVILTWVFLWPSMHFYLGQIEAIGGAYGVTWAGLIDVLLFGFAVAVLVSSLLHGRAPKPFLFWPVALYLAAWSYAVLISPVMALGVRGALVGSVAPLFYLNTVMLSRGRNLSKTVARVIVLSSLFPMAVAFIQMLSLRLEVAASVASWLPAHEYTLLPYPGLGVPRVSGSIWDFNPFAVFMGLSFLAVLLRLDNRFGGFRRWLWLILAAVLIFASFTRAVWLSLSVVCLLVLPFVSSRTRFALVALAMLALLGTIVTPVRGLLAARLLDTQSLSDRAVLRSYGLSVFMSRPLGYGAGMARVLTDELIASISFALRGGLTGGFAFHNDYVTHAVEGGVFLLGAYLLLLFTLMVLALRTYRLARSQGRSPKWGVWLAAATLMLAAIALTDSGLGYGGFVFWLLVACVDMELRTMRVWRTTVHPSHTRERPVQPITSHAHAVPDSE